MHRTSARGTITMSRALFALVTWLVVGSLMGITVWLALIEISVR
jgi:hypothetical protein